MRQREVIKTSALEFQQVAAARVEMHCKQNSMLDI